VNTGELPFDRLLDDLCAANRSKAEHVLTILLNLPRWGILVTINMTKAWPLFQQCYDQS
jgi:hypothetical protein